MGRLERLLLALRRLSEPAVRSLEPFDAPPFLAHFLEQYGYEIERRGIVVDARPAQPGAVAADPEALSQVLLELLNVAVQRLGRAEEPRLEIAAGPRGQKYAIELVSNGRAAEEGRELPFTTAKLGPRDEDFRLALAISRQILLQMGAVVTTVQNGPESWTSRIELPLAAARE